MEVWVQGVIMVRLSWEHFFEAADCQLLLEPSHTRKRERRQALPWCKRVWILFLRVPFSQLHLILNIFQRPHLQILSHWGTGFQCIILQGHIHSLRSIQRKKIAEWKISPSLSVITLNINILNFPIKDLDWQTGENHMSICYLPRDSRAKDTSRLKLKEWKKIDHENSIQRGQQWL